MKWTYALIVSSLALVMSLANAAETTAAAAPVAAGTNLSTTVAPEAKKSSILDSIVLGYKSYNDSGRFGFQNQDVSKDSFAGRSYKGKHEVKLGYKHSSGWGAYGQITQNRSNYRTNPNNNSKWSSSDPSLTLTHPSFYDDGTLKLFGSARYYVPNADRSKDYGVRQLAYYFDMTYKLAADREIFNEVNPRVFKQDRYNAADTRMKIEDITTITQKLGAWGRYGVGQWTQYEQHAESPNGLTVDVYPFFDYTFSNKIFVGPRLYLPVLVEQTVYDGSRAATWENAYFQMFISASL